MKQTPIEVLHGTRETVIYDENMAIRVHFNNRTCEYPEHIQPSFEIIMPICNDYTVIVNSKTIILHPGDILIIPPGVLHSICACDGGTRYILLFDPSIFYHIKGLESLVQMYYPFVHLTSDNTPLIHELNRSMHQIYKDFISDDYLKYASMYSSIINIILLSQKFRQYRYINTFANNTKDNHNAKYIKKFEEICQYINNNCMEDITVQALANHCGFSQSHFIRLFKEFTNVSYNAYLTQCRINYAKLLLATDPDSSVSEISVKSK